MLCGAVPRAQWPPAHAAASLARPSQALGRVKSPSETAAWQAVEDGVMELVEPPELAGRTAVFSNAELLDAGGGDGAAAAEAPPSLGSDSATWVGAPPPQSEPRGGPPPEFPLAAGDEVECQVVENAKLGLLRCVKMQRRWLLGQVSSLKESFGFVACVTKPLDLFFHASYLEPPLAMDTIQIGTEVEFQAGVDPKASNERGEGSGGALGSTCGVRSLVGVTDLLGALTWA